MSLPKNYTLAPSRIPELFDKIRDGQAPDQLSLQVLKDWGFTSSNDRALLPLLKTIGFLSPDGKPTSAYHDYRDHSASRKVLGRQLREAYKDLFLIKEFPTEADREAIQGKFKSYHNVSDRVAGLMAKTFYTLVDLADLKQPKSVDTKNDSKEESGDMKSKGGVSQTQKDGKGDGVSIAGLHYNVQIHLPPTKDIEVYNAIFKSLKEHLINE